MSRPSKYPWFTWFNEDTHRIARWVFSSMSDKSIISTVQIQAKRMSVFAKVSVCERWVWITATRKTLAKQHLSENPAK